LTGAGRGGYTEIEFHNQEWSGARALKRLLERIDREILAAGGKRSRSRAIVIEGFFRARDHVTIEGLTRSVRESAPGIGAVTVYRTLKLLERLGYAKELDFGEGARRYESNLSPHHDHLVCRQCGTVIEFEDKEIETLQDLVTRRHGFHPTAHRLEIYGFCRKCASGKSPERSR
jgi:Fur family ferric uptake transcriptional regulator